LAKLYEFSEAHIIAFMLFYM